MRHTQVVVQLVQHGVNCNMPNHDGNTPMHYALMLVNPSLAKVLLAAGAAAAPLNVRGRTPRDVAVAHGFRSHVAVKILDKARRLVAPEAVKLLDKRVSSLSSLCSLAEESNRYRVCAWGGSRHYALPSHRRPSPIRRPPTTRRAQRGRATRSTRRGGRPTRCQRRTRTEHTRPLPRMGLPLRARIAWRRRRRL
jgi:hypothetical protein